MPKVSVIVPIYGVENYIRRCAESLFNQTLEDIEFIFVNDCTKDKSIDILNECIIKYPKLKNKIKIIHHKENRGLPQARKTGYINSTGEYIAYCDGDDWTEKGMYQQMYEKAVSEKADLVICGYYTSDGKSNKIYDISETNGLLMGPVWNKLIKRQLFETDIEFPIANKAEDGAIMMQLSYYSKKRAYIHNPFYYYYSNPTSICRLLDEDSCISKMKQECENVEFRLDFLKRKGEIYKYYKDIIKWKFEARNNLVPCIAQKHIFDLWNKTYPEIGGQILKSGNCRIIIKYFLLKLRLFPIIKYIR